MVCFQLRKRVEVYIVHISPPIHITEPTLIAISTFTAASYLKSAMIEIFTNGSNSHYDHLLTNQLRQFITCLSSTDSDGALAMTKFIVVRRRRIVSVLCRWWILWLKATSLLQMLLDLDLLYQ